VFGLGGCALLCLVIYESVVAVTPFLGEISPGYLRTGFAGGLLDGAGEGIKLLGGSVIELFGYCCAPVDDSTEDL
jgi:hypothetical protein